MPPVTVKEFDEITAKPGGLSPDNLKSLKVFAEEHLFDDKGDFHPVLLLKGGKLYAQNYVGVITVSKKTVLEILPKIDLAEDGETKTREIFLNMLRYWRGLKFAQLGRSDIRKLQHFNMLEVFFRLFLENLVLLTQRGLARHYHAAQDNLPYLKGRILFPQHIRANLTNRARFYVEYDKFSADRPANRLIHTTIARLMSLAREPENQQLLYQLKICFSDIPLSVRLESDWQKHRIDRSMQYYDAVMRWVGLFLFGYGLSTFAGDYEENQALLFPMEEIYEDFITHSFQTYQSEFQVQPQGPRRALAEIKGRKAFNMRPDISLISDGNAEYILDAKWKRISGSAFSAPKHDISQSDVYQLYAYGKKYGCRTVALVYPRTNDFKDPLRYRLDDDLTLLCLPFDVANPKGSVTETIKALGKTNATS